MKTKLHLQPFTFALLATLALCLTALPARAQSNNMTISAAGFQSMVYSAQLHTELTLKPELEASLRVLLEMQRRNPGADPIALVGVLTNALQIYCTSEPCYIRTNGSPVEILAAFLDALRQVPARTNFVSADLTLLNNFMLGSDDYYMATSNGVDAGQLIYSLAASGQQHLFSTQTDAIRRQALVDDCVARAQGNAAFAAAMDGLLVPETGVALADTPAEIIGNPNSPLHYDLTMTNLLALSEASGNGSLTVSSNLLSNLFTNEMQTFWDICNTNLAVLSTINQSQPDLLSKLTNQAANAQLVAGVQQGQPATLACATAAVLVQSKLLTVTAPQSSEADQIMEAASAGVEIGTGILSLCMEDPQGGNSLMSGILDTFNMCSGTESVADQTQDEMVTEIQNTQTMIGDLSANMNLQFDQVDESLTNIFDTMNGEFANITYISQAQGQQIAQLKESVADLRYSLMSVQTSIDYLEQELNANFQTLELNSGLRNPADDALFYQLRYEGSTLDLGNSGEGYEYYENTFHDFAVNDASDDILSPSLNLNLSPSYLQTQLTTTPLDANLNYIQQYLSTVLVQTTQGTPPLPNPTDWFAGAYALMQLDVENPMLFRKISAADVTDTINNGGNLVNFLRSLTFSAPCAKSNCYPEWGIVEPKGCYP